jgi:serine protease Do
MVHTGLSNSRRREVAQLLTLVVSSLLVVGREGGAEVSLPLASPRLERIFAGAAPENVDELKAMEEYTRLLARKVVECTVSVQLGMAHGSGVIVSPEGVVLTAAHVLGSPGRSALVRLADGQVVRARSLGMHLQHDAGALRIQDPGPWPYLQLGDVGRVRKGSWCAATGHPGGYYVDRGPVFRLGRILDTNPMLRSDCQLAGGDSGGPLVDMGGRVIGVHSRIGTSLANNLHIPISVFQQYWEALLAGKIWNSSSFLGVRGDSSSNVAQVTFVHEGSPAHRAGIRVNDVIVRFAGQPVHSFVDLVQMVQLRHPGEVVRVEFIRDGARRKVDVRISSRDRQ